ncbi:Activity-regulated cytoskeleton associated protein 2 [Eumeta japonica]|uniref:Activity-regulated cytoskeleton associated protein 2 n=1 Tax=Eumeta variegata TaxID=151549 RepID=A0A4C1Y443_EUMVA|nr:Activity-regulated cytoskeleton associated protein 2 [Eumeta japonica]
MPRKEHIEPATTARDDKHHDGSGIVTRAQLPPPPHLTGSSVAPRSPCLTCATLAALLSTLARSQAESNRILIQSLLAPAPNGDGTTSPTPSSAALGSPFCSAASARSGSFAKCTARFDGSASDPDVLETFLDAIEVYKECLNINDEHALRGLPILLTGNAAVWWRGGSRRPCFCAWWLPGTGRVEWPARAATASSPSAGGAAACSAPSMSHAASSRVTRAPLDTSSAVSPGVATARASDNGDTHPRALSNIRQLSIDFIRKAGLIINLSTNTWLTADRPHVIYPLRCETSVHTIECASTDVLRIDEGTMLSPPERDDLARLLQEYQDIFTQGGGPTPFAEHRIDTGDHPPIAVPPYRLTPYLLKLVDTLQNSKESAERQQDLRKSLKDKSRRDGTLIVGDLVLMKTHVLSSSIKGVTSKFVPKRDGPYLIHKKVSPTTYLLAYPETPDKPIGKYHISDLKRYHAREDACSNVPEPVIPKRRRGRPRKIPIIQ